MTLAVPLILCAILVLGGTAVLFVGWRSLHGRLSRNRFAGVRTPATMRSESTFELGNRVAAPATLAGGAVLVLAGVSLPMLGTTFSVGMVLGIGLVGATALLLIGGVLGHRAAASMPEPVPTGSCAGCSGGCSLLQRC